MIGSPFHLTCGDCMDFDRCSASEGAGFTDPCCSEIRNRHTARCSSCLYYMPVNQAGGLCIYQIRTGKERQQMSDGYDDAVNAGDCCRQWADGERKKKNV